MAIQAVRAQTAETTNINKLLAIMGVKMDEAVGRAIAALLHTDSHVVARACWKASAGIQELELTLIRRSFPPWKAAGWKLLKSSGSHRQSTSAKTSHAWASLPPTWDKRSLKWANTMSMKTSPGSSRWPSRFRISAARLCARWRVLIQCWRATPLQVELPWMPIVIMCCVGWTATIARHRRAGSAFDLCFALPGADRRQRNPPGGEPGYFSGRPYEPENHQSMAS